MTSVLVPILVFSIVFNLVVYTSAAPTLIQDILDVFGNPFKDFKKSILQETQVNATYVEDNLTTKPPDNSAGKMIDVPLTTVRVAKVPIWIAAASAGSLGSNV
ncbi:hypothetical protein O3G_MSEX014833 [Manduca sexta]|uniref:Uncharacterized protein n=1 Tax=Manduca sexta TaxID=7130 RepID=A0A921ZVS7_MANSE|nr:hypothetical protein O3G_MSEX014833 [Manduca sexta]KAG6464954.1 hypothetical protein O3G_MSEX014833 [Manduca sexta]